MSDSFMTTEGDRSGTDIPTRFEKTKHQLEALRTTVDRLLAGWDTITPRSLVGALGQIEDEVARAVHQATSAEP